MSGETKAASGVMSGDWQNAWIRAVAKSWKDPAFKQRLLSNPADALSDFGFKLPKSYTLKVVEPAQGQGWDDKSGEWNLDPVKLEITVPLPPKPKAELVTVEALALSHLLGNQSCGGGCF